MAAPTYTTDLADITLNEAIGTWTETGTWTTGTAPAIEPDFFIQGANCVAKYWTTGGGGGTASGAIFDAASALTIPSPGAYFVWINEQCPNNIATEANGGLRVIMGDSSTAFNGWSVGGSDTYTLGGWLCAAVDPAVTDDFVVGAPVEDSTRRWFGAGVLQTATAKGGLGIDALRYGRGELRSANGDVTNGYASFGGSSPDAGIAAYDMNNTRAWGLCIPTNGTFLVQGLFVMGLAGTAVDFRDSNRAVFIQNTKKVISTFNGFEVRNASSRVDWTNITVTALGTVSRGFFTVTDNADVNLSFCTFTNMDAFTFLSASAATDCTFRSTLAIAAPGSDMRRSLVTGSRVAANASALVYATTSDTDGKLDDMTFVMGTNNHHAITLGGSSLLPNSGSVTLRNCTFTGFSASDAADDSVILLADTGADVAWTINAVNCSGTVSVKKTRSGDTFTVVSDPVTVAVNVKDGDGANIQDARVLIKAVAGGPFPFEGSVTISNSGTTATVTHTAHGMATNDKVIIKGASHAANNGLFTITFISSSSYSYTMLSAPGSSPTGTITSTFVALAGLTDASGNISASRVYSTDQPITGWVRKASASTFYKNAPIGGSVDSATGLSVSIQMIEDE